MGTNKKIIIVILISFGLLPIFQLAHAQEIHKWVDEKGVVHFVDDSGTVIGSVVPQTAATKKADELARQNILKEATAPSSQLPQRSYYDAHPGEYEFEMAKKEYLKAKARAEWEQRQRELQEEMAARRAQAAQQAAQADLEQIKSDINALRARTINLQMSTMP